MLREAKRLHRAATSDALSEALPVLRRLLAARAVPACPLQALFRDRASLQRKHVLRMLAFEAGHASWEAYSQALAQVLHDAGRLQAVLDNLPPQDFGLTPMESVRPSMVSAWFSRRRSLV